MIEFGIFLDKRIETVATIFGASAAGGVFVPINPLLRSRQVAYILGDCDVRVLITSKERYELLRADLSKLKTLEYVVLINDAPGAKPEAAHRLSQWRELIAIGEAKLVDVGVIDVDMAAIFYTSGSTGSPKGVVISHRNLICGAESVASYLHNNPSDVVLAALPLSFDAGFSSAHHRIQLGGARRSYQLLVAFRHRESVRKARGNGPDLCATIVDPDRRVQMARRRSPNAALFR